MNRLVSCLLCLLVSCSSCERNAEVMMARQVSYLAIGDSYTYGGGLSKGENYPVQLSEILNKDPDIEVRQMRILAQNGWLSSELRNAISGLPSGQTYDIITILIGTNDIYSGKSANDYSNNLRVILDKAVKSAAHKKGVIMISIPDYGYTPHGKSKQPEISAMVDSFNTMNKELADSFGISYVDITTISRSNETGMVASDGFHASAKQHSLWTKELYFVIKGKIFE